MRDEIPGLYFGGSSTEEGSPDFHGPFIPPDNHESPDTTPPAWNYNLYYLMYYENYGEHDQLMVLPDMIKNDEVVDSFWLENVPVDASGAALYRINENNTLIFSDAGAIGATNDYETLPNEFTFKIYAADALGNFSSVDVEVTLRDIVDETVETPQTDPVIIPGTDDGSGFFNTHFADDISALLWF